MADLIGYHELFALAAMLALFFLGAFAFKLPIGLSMALGALAGAAVGGRLWPADDLVRHLVEGMFAYLDPILIIATATIFMFALERNGMLSALADRTLRALGHSPFLLLAAITLIVMLPGMLTGSSTASVLTTGALMAPVLMRLGVPRDKAGAVVAMAALLGMSAPPVNIPALIIGAGVDLPYVGLDLPLLVLTVPMALVTTWGLALPHCSPVGREPAASSSQAKAPIARPSILIYAPLVVVIGLLLAERAAPHAVGLGLPLIFVLGTALATVTGARFALAPTAADAMRAALPILGILMGVGMFIQVMTLTGARGELVIQSLRLQRGWLGLYPVIGIMVPLMGAVSSFGAASVLGVPFVLTLPIGGNAVIVNTSALASIVALGDLMPPTALAGIFAAQVVGEPNYLRVLRWCVIPGVAIAVQGLLFIQFAEPLAKLLVAF